ncbi:unnamed protein product [Haemonchus placei]|uniref:Non-specific serine/threonine protein kinase n=1 Tax=Haemonchus placei TaxID=6290 RepID=A0A158QNN0_HAEPC|nr:unnamed protein product [Haemonchus placei]
MQSQSQSSSPMMSTQVPSAMRTPSGTPSQAGLSQIAAISRMQQQQQHSALRRDSPDRTSLSKRHMQDGQPRTVWSPQTMTPKRATSSMQSITPSGAAASAITRRQSEKFYVRFASRKEDNEVVAVGRRRHYLSLPRQSSVAKEADFNDSNLHLRSRSQSPNHMLLNQQNRPLPNSASRELTKELQRRRDSDMSYTAASSRLTPANSRSNLRSVGVDGDTRKSTDALNRIAALRNKLHQSSENLRKSSDNLRLTSAGDSENAPTRTRSSSNLRGANALEAYGTIDADQLDSASSLMHSRLLARSVGNVSSVGSGAEGEATPASRLQNTIDMLKKASNPDLTQCSLYEDPGSPCGEKMRRRGAVQKKVERYHPRHRTARNQTSEESDSNGSDASPLNQSLNRRLLSSGTNRSVSAVETSGRLGMASRRLFDQQRYGATPSSTTVASPRRTQNYLAQKMAGEDMVGPDLGSDDSPRSSVNSHEWAALLEDGAANQQLLRHAQDCFEKLQVYVDKAVQARMMVDESSMTAEHKRIAMAQMEKMTQKIVEKLIPGARSPSSIDDANGNDYTPIKGPHIYTAVKSSFRQ